MKTALVIVTVIAVFGSAAYVAHEFISAGHWICGMITFLLPLFGIKIKT